MKFVTVREFRANTAQVRRELDTEREVVLTSNGKPFAMLTPVEAGTVEEEAAAIRQARARLAIERIREHARRKGLDRMTMAEIDALIAAAIAESGAASVKDMGKVVASLKPKLAGRADMAKVSAKVKAKLG